MDPFKKLNKIKDEQLDNFDFKDDASRMRQTKEWRVNREKYLENKNKCAWCGSEPESFHIHHTWGKSFSRQWMKATDDAFVESSYYSKELTNNRDECPNCHKRDYYERKTKSPKYRCNNCQNEFDEPKHLDGGQAIKSDKYGNKPYAKYKYYKEKAKWVENNKDKVLEKFKKRYNKLLDEYVSLREDQVTAICDKCHYKEEMTNKVRCKNCESNWYDPNNNRDNMCWSCIVDEKGLEKCPNCQENWYQPDKNKYCKDCR